MSRGSGRGGGDLLIEYHSVLFYSSDGIGRTGSFCAAYSMMDRFKVEQVVDAFQTIKSMRIQRAGLLDSLVYCGHGLLCLCFPSQLCHHMFMKHCCICRVSMFTDLETEHLAINHNAFVYFLTSSLPYQAQYIFLHSAVLEFLSTFDAYQNFK